jgi:hypothetical protein
MSITKRYRTLTVLGVLLLLSLFGGVAQAQRVVIGANIVNPYVLTKADQDAILSEMNSAGVRVIRASITFDDRGIDFAESAWNHGIKIEWLIYHFGGYDPFGQRPLSAAGPDQFRKSFLPILAGLEDRGITLAGFELGNEINLSGTNPEFPPRRGNGKQLGLDDLNRTPEGKQIAKGYLQYLQVMAVLKQARDHSTLNRHTPIMTAGLGTYEQDDGPLPKWAKGDVVSINATLEYMRAHGLDSLVDAYAVHVYPDSQGPGDPKFGAQRKSSLANYVLTECRALGSRDGKPCWITEWGFNNTDMTCPIDNTNRTKLVKEMMSDFRSYVLQGRLAGLMYFSWNSDPTTKNISVGSIWRCGALTEGGQLSLDQASLK